MYKRKQNYKNGFGSIDLHIYDDVPQHYDGIAMGEFFFFLLRQYFNFERLIYVKIFFLISNIWSVNITMYHIRFAAGARICINKRTICDAFFFLLETWTIFRNFAVTGEIYLNSRRNLSRKSRIIRNSSTYYPTSYFFVAVMLSCYIHKYIVRTTDGGYTELCVCVCVLCKCI